MLPMTVRASLPAALLGVALLLGAHRGGAEEPAALPKLPKVWKTFEDNLDGAQISPDGKYVVVLERTDRVAIVYRRDTGKEHCRCPRSSSAFFAFSPDSKELVTISGYRNKDESATCEAVVWDLATGKRARGCDLYTSRDINAELGRLYAASDKTLVMVGQDKLIVSYDLSNGKRLGDFANKGHRPTKAALSPDGKWLLTAGEKNELRVWDVKKRALEHELFEHSWKVSAVAISADGKWCASATDQQRGNDKTGRIPARLWLFDREKGTSHCKTDLLMVKVGQVCFTHEGNTLLVTGGGYHHGLNVWDWRDSKLIRGGLFEDEFRRNRSTIDKTLNLASIRGCGVSSDGTLLTQHGKNLRLWQVNLEEKKK